MVDHARLRETVRSFTEILGGSYHIGDVLYDLADDVLGVLGCDGVGVAVRDPHGGLRFVAASDERVACIEEHELEVRDGPCHEALASGEQVVSGDLEDEARWPAYRPVALERGARAVAGVPLLLGETPIGALSLYRLSPKTVCTDEDLQTAQLLADLATGYLTNQKALAEADKLNEQLRHALDSRVVIEQAKGVLAQRHDLDPGVAFELLRSHTRSVSRPIHDVAGEVVAGELELDPPGDPVAAR